MNKPFEISIGGWIEKYYAIETNAPKQYDFSATIHLYGDENPDKESRRWVLIPTHNLMPQTGRYASGLYRSEPVEEICESFISEIIHKRIFGRAS